MLKNKKYLSLAILSIFLFFVFVFPVLATENELNESIAEDEKISKNFSIFLDEPTIAKGYTVSAFDESLKLSLVPGIISSSTRVDGEIIEEDMPTPWNLKRISPIYQFEFRNKASYDDHNPFYIQFSYPEKSDSYKKVFFYDKNYNSWRELPTRDWPEEKFVRSLIHLPFARIAVFEAEEIMTVGKASWYAYKNGNFAASPDFPKTSRLRVYNLDNEKFVDVEINDYGPDRSIHPDRAIDLDKVAFSKIASTGAGIINVKIEPLYIPLDSSGKILGLTKDSTASIEPQPKAKSTIVMNEATGEIIFEKNSSQILPIASLTKLTAIKIFLDQNIGFDKIATYRKSDEEYNYEHCEMWESSRLKVKDGDTMTIENLVYSSLVGSANNTIESLVRESGLARQDFIKKMNDFARSLGALNTRFVEPTGLSPENVSTALDYAIITKEIFKNPLIEKISATPKYEFYTINSNSRHALINTNHFIRDNFFASANNLKITGSKTGYLHESLHCLTVKATGPGGEKVLVMNLGAPTRDESFEEVKELIRYGVKKIK